MQLKYLASLVGLLFSTGLAQPKVNFQSILKQALTSDQKIQALQLKIDSKEYSIAAQNTLKQEQDKFKVEIELQKAKAEFGLNPKMST